MCKGVHMTEAATKWVGQVIDGKFRLGEFVGGDEGSSVFLTDYDSAGRSQGCNQIGSGRFA